MTPFELLFGTKMKSCQDIEIVELLNEEITAQFQEQRDALRQDAKKQIYKVEDENRRTGTTAHEGKAYCAYLKLHGVRCWGAYADVSFKWPFQESSKLGTWYYLAQ
ncbi:hypothetical protein TNCV_637781 [Trichonephila clavipes]|nr:hypothetical protein TNCV_637781 [Trichonephila clavipes]